MGAVAVAFVLENLPARFGQMRPFLLLNGSVLVAAWYGGRGPAAVATALSAAAAAYVFLLSPLRVSAAAGAVNLGLFVAEASLIAALTVASAEARSCAQALADRCQRSERQLQKLNKAHRALSVCNEALVRAEDDGVLLEEICRAIVEVAGYRMCWVGRAERDEAKTVRPIARAGLDVGYVDRAEVTWADSDHGRGPVGTAIRTGRPYVPQDVGDAAFGPWRSAALDRGYRSVISLPLFVCDQVFGALTIYAAEKDAFDDDEAVQLLAELSRDLAYGIGALHARAEIASERARFETAVMQAPIAVAVYAGPDHVVRLANRRWFALGRGLDSIGKPIREVLPEAARAGALAGLDEVYAKGEPKEVTEHPIPVERPDGSSDTLFFNIACQPLMCSGGVVSEIIVAISDVTEQVKARRVVEEARAVAEQASRAKDEFLRMISHELRSPLVPILALAETLKKEGNRSSAAVARCLDIILSNARAEARLVEDLIDVSQFVAGAVHLEIDPVDLGTVVQAIVDELRPAAEAKPVHLEVSIPPDTVVWGDAGRLSQMARHLLSNALKFTPPGGTIRVEIVRERAALRLMVHDTGAGIPPDQLTCVFEPFQTCDGSIKRAYGGLGLGLYLAKRIAEAHGGTVWAESDGPGRGTTLVAELAAPPAAAPAAA